MIECLYLFSHHMIVNIKYIALCAIQYGILHGVLCIYIQHVLKFLQIVETVYCASMFVMSINAIVFLNGTTSCEINVVVEKGTTYGFIEMPQNGIVLPEINGNSSFTLT